MEHFIKQAYIDHHVMPHSKGLNHLTYVLSPVLSERLLTEAKQRGYEAIETDGAIIINFN